MGTQGCRLEARGCRLLTGLRRGMGDLGLGLGLG